MNLEIEKFSPTKAELAQLVERARLVTKENPQEEIHETRMKLVKTRTAITKTGEELRKDAVKFQKDVIALVNGFLEIIEPEEERLAGIEDQIKQEKMWEERKALLPQRRVRLAEFVGVVSDEVLLDMDGPTFEGYLNEKMAEKNRAEQERIDAEKRALENERFQAFLAEHGCSEQTKDTFHIERSDADVKLYKLVGIFKTK